MPRLLPLTLLCLLPLAATFRMLKKSRRCNGSIATQDCDPESLRQEEPPTDVDDPLPFEEEPPTDVDDPLPFEEPPADEPLPSEEPPTDEPLPFDCVNKNVTDKKKCGSTLNTSQTCLGVTCSRFSPDLTCPQCWVAKTCEVQDKCPFRLRLYITGTLEVFSVKHVSASIAYTRHEITGNKLVTDWFAWFPLTRDFLISTAFSLGNNYLQDQLPNIRPKLIEAIGTALKNPETFNKLDLTTRLAIGPNITKFMELVPDITLRTKINTATGAMNTTLVIPEMTDHTTLSSCGTVGGRGNYWPRVAVASAIGALLAWRYPRVGIAVAIVGVFLSRAEITEPACQAVLPKITRDSGITIPKSMQFDESVQELGLPPAVSYYLNFIGDNLHILITQIDVPLLNKIVNNAAAKFGKDILKPDDGSEAKLDLSIAGANLDPDSDGHIINLRSKTYIDADSYLDADCLKKWIGTTICLAMKLR